MGDELQDGLSPEQTETAAPVTADKQQPAETPAEGEDHQEEQPAPQPKKGIEKRFSELTARAKAAEAYAARLEMLMDRQQQTQQPQQPQPQQPPPQVQPPDRYDFDSDEAYKQAMDRYIDYKYEVKQRQQQEQQRRAQAEFQQRQYYDSLTQKVSHINDTGAQKYEDFSDVAYVPNILLPAVAESDAPEEIAYYLGKHPAEAERLIALAQQNPTRCMVEMGRLEAKLKAPVQRRQTSAPAPIDPVGARGAVEKDPEKMTTAEWIAWRNKQTAR